MNLNLNHTELFNKKIREILLKDWDPIGVKDISEAQSEYDSYIPRISQMILANNSVHEIFEYLWWIETEHMGLDGNKKITNLIATALHSLNHPQ